ncbi:MAG: hypothetical protein DIU78_004885 [Pseudomonadota bacterium]
MAVAFAAAAGGAFAPVPAALGVAFVAFAALAVGATLPGAPARPASGVARSAAGEP